MSIESASAVGGDIAARIAQIQQMAQQLGFDGGASSTGFQSALDSASSASSATNVSSTTNAPVSGTPYASEINAAAQKYGIDPSLLAGLVKQESGFNPNATSAVGAKGLTQLMPATAKSLGVTDPTNPAQSLDGGAHYLKEQLDRFGGDVTKAVAAYNAGPGAVQRYNGVPPYAETQNYVKNVLANRDEYAKTAAANGTIATGTSATSATQIAGVGATDATGSAASTASALSRLSGLTTGGVSTASVSNPLSSSLAALSTGDDSSDNSSNLSLGSSSSSAAAGASSSLGYPTT